MIHIVLFAFFGTRITDFCTRSANESGKLTTTAHEFSGSAADSRAVDIKSDAARHRLHILLLQAGARAVIASNCALVTGVDARLHSLVSHGEISLRVV